MMYATLAEPAFSRRRVSRMTVESLEYRPAIEAGVSSRQFYIEVIRSRRHRSIVPRLSCAKKPKKDNRKAPDYAADTLGPALFSTPDIIRRSVQPEPHVNFDGGNSIISGSENEQKSESKASLPEHLQPSLDTGGIEGEEHLLATLEMEANKFEELLAEALLLQEELGVDLAEHFVELVELDNKAQVTQLLGDEKISTRRGSRSSLANIEREQSHEEANSSLPLV
ncbi:uncharacterized protein [Temnothorax longispinosus]|uniref:uncharacterized protein isoform X2 n=1 Tax=Temnothorax longispinosus TaxID=300112 RepID=UPI003A99F3D0